MKTKKPIEMLVRILANGGRVFNEGYEYAMGEDGSLCVVFRDEQGNEKPVAIDCDLKAFNKMAESIGMSNLWIQCCAMQLNRGWDD